MLRRSLLALAILAVLPATSLADPFTAWGPQFGFSSGPDQFVVGGHLKWGGVAPSLDFVPSVDFAFGDNSSVVSVNGDFHYRLDTRTQWRPYLGGGVGVHFVSINNEGTRASDNTNTVSGGQFIAGADVLAKNGNRFFAEMKLGFSDSPDMKVMAGFNFKAR